MLTPTLPDHYRETTWMRIWSEYRSFFREFRHNFHHTGAILPSGPFLARALVRPLRGQRPPARILEVGPGTGAVTAEIARRMLPDDRLDAVEINPAFARLLEQRIAGERVFAPHREQIQVINAPVEQLIGESVYDFIISGLPLNNFTSAEVRSVFAAFRRLVRPDGLLSYFEYTFVRQLKAPFVGRGERRRLVRIGWLLGRFVRAHQVRRERVLLNVPPATVRQLRLKPASAPAEAIGGPV
jgi:phospholipid N-methyltransferase